MSLWVLHHSGQRVSGGHVTLGAMSVSNRSLVVMSLWGLCHTGQQVNGGHVNIGAMSQWAAGQKWPCHYGGYITVGCGSVVAMSL